MSPGAVLLIVDATLDAAASGLPDAEARLEAVLPILVRAARRAGALHREARPGASRADSIAQVLRRAGDIAVNGRETMDGEARG